LLFHFQGKTAFVCAHGTFVYVNVKYPSLRDGAADITPAIVFGWKNSLLSTMNRARSQVAVLLFILSMASFPVNGQETLQLTSASLVDLKNKPARLAMLDKPMVLLILGTDCPITQKYIPTIENLKKSFGGFGFVGIFPNQYSVAEVAAFVDEYQISFPCYIDQEREVIEMLGATVTPEAFLVSSTHRVLYAGAIDNWFYKLGSYRSKVTKHYLADAIRAHLDGKRITIDRTEAIGCPVPQRGTGTKSPTHSHH
jgi:thiol-disulfide isomerase/thioredoxin